MMFQNPSDFTISLVKVDGKVSFNGDILLNKTKHFTDFQIKHNSWDLNCSCKKVYFIDNVAPKPFLKGVGAFFYPDKVGRVPILILR